MRVTIQQIADRAGVSRGTVDRALNNRGRIAPEVAEKIRNIAKELGYTPAIRKRSEIKKKKIKIGIINQLAKSSFMLEVNKGIQQAKEELTEWGIEIIVKEVLSVDEKIQLKYIEELAELGIDGLAIMPVNCESIRSKLNWLIEQKKIPVVTFNSDIVGTKRCCFVGMDNQKSGQTAAGLMNMLTGGIGKILIITGFFSNSVNNSRVDGFIEEIKNNYPQLSIACVNDFFDEGDEVQRFI